MAKFSVSNVRAKKTDRMNFLFRVDPEFKERLRECAAKNNVSMSEFVIRAVEYCVAQVEGKE